MLAWLGRSRQPCMQKTTQRALKPRNRPALDVNSGLRFATLTPVPPTDLPETESLKPRSRLFRFAPLWVSILAVIVIASVTGVLSGSIRELERTRTMVDHTNTVLHTIDGILIDMEEAESRQRGYIITGKA